MHSEDIVIRRIAEICYFLSAFARVRKRWKFLQIFLRSSFPIWPFARGTRGIRRALRGEVKIASKGETKVEILERRTSHVYFCVLMRN